MSCNIIILLLHIVIYSLCNYFLFNIPLTFSLTHWHFYNARRTIWCFQVMRTLFFFIFFFIRTSFQDYEKNCWYLLQLSDKLCFTLLYSACNFFNFELLKFEKDGKHLKENTLTVYIIILDERKITLITYLHRCYI